MDSHRPFICSVLLCKEKKGTGIIYEKTVSQQILSLNCGELCQHCSIPSKFSVYARKSFITISPEQSVRCLILSQTVQVSFESNLSWNSCTDNNEGCCDLHNSRKNCQLAPYQVQGSKSNKTVRIKLRGFLFQLSQENLFHLGVSEFPQRFKTFYRVKNLQLTHQ